MCRSEPFEGDNVDNSFRALDCNPTCPVCGAKLHWSLSQFEPGATAPANCAAIALAYVPPEARAHRAKVYGWPDPDCEWTGKIMRVDGGGVVVVVEH